MFLKRFCKVCKINLSKKYYGIYNIAYLNETSLHVRGISEI